MKPQNNDENSDPNIIKDDNDLRTKKIQFPILNEMNELESVVACEIR